jgi:phosphonate transport system ATP-binding protein
MQDGKLIFDGTPDELTEDALTLIYGEEDWKPEAKAGSPVEQENADSPEQAAAV